MTERARVPLHRDPKFRALVFQILALGFVVYGFYSLFQTTIDNLVARGIQTGTSFFDEVAPFQIGFSPFFDFKLGESTYIDVFFVGIQNTILVAVLGIIAATILGFFIGVIRLSLTGLSLGVRSLTSRFLGTFHCCCRLCSGISQYFCRHFHHQKTLSRWALFLNARGFHTPLPVVDDSTGFTIWIAMLVILCAGLVALARRANRRFEETGEQLPIGWISLGAIFGGGYLLYLIAGSPLVFDEPVLGRFNFKGGGQLPLPLFSLWFALTLYTAAFIAENVRAGIQAVSQGQMRQRMHLGFLVTPLCVSSQFHRHFA